MSEERKGRRWPWGIAALLVLYPLSIGPFAWFMVQLYGMEADLHARPFYDTVYAPILWLAGEYPTIRSMLDWWQRLFVPPPA